MTGQEVIDWILENKAEGDVIYIEVNHGLFKASNEMEVLGDSDCPCMEMVIMS